MKNRLSCPQFSLQNTENCILEGFGISKFSGETLPLLPKKKVTNGSLLIQLVTLFKPTGYFNYFY